MGLLDNILGSKPPSEDQFAKMLIDGIRRAGETAKRYTALRGRLRGL